MDSPPTAIKAHWGAEKKSTINEKIWGLDKLRAYRLSLSAAGPYGQDYLGQKRNELKSDQELFFF